MQMDASRSNLAGGSNPSQFANVESWNFDGCYYNIMDDENLQHNADVHEVQGLPSDDVEVHSTSATKKVARRAKNFSHQEDEVICSAWINGSQDAIIGMNQTSGGLVAIGSVLLITMTSTSLKDHKGHK